MFSLSNSSTDLVQMHSSLALNQLSEEDRKIVARLKQTYPSHILAAVFQDAEHSHHQAAWDQYRSRESTASSTLCLSNVPSLDSDTYCSSTTTARSSLVYQESLFKKRSSSVSCGTTLQRQRHRSRRSTASAAQEPKEMRITLKPPMDSFPVPQTVTAKQPVKTKTLYFCTTCEESFQERHDWQQHEDAMHEQQYYWTCPSSDCDSLFTKEDLFTQHHQRAHGCGKCTHASEAQHPLPSKRSWGCGFDKCKGVFDSWDMRCAHVSGHFEGLAQHDDTSSQPSQWKYANMIRNLLRQPDVQDAYRRVMTKCHGNDKIFWPKMNWDPSSSEELKRRLEYRDFRSGVKNLARMACQLGHPVSTDTVRITLEPAEDDSPVESPSPDSPTIADPNYLHHIDKFPQPGTNPFDSYGPVPPSPIIQLDFLADLDGPDPEVAHLHSTKNSLSGAPYSLYPSPMINEREMATLPPPPPPPPTVPLPLPPAADPSLLQTPELVHELTAPSSLHMAFPAAPTFTPVVPALPRDGLPPRPKTPMAMIRSAKSLMRKRSAAHVGGGVPIGQAQAFDPVLAAQAIQTYHAR